MLDLLIIGAGISGITAALDAAERGVRNVLIVDHRSGPGGFTGPFQRSSLFKEESELAAKAESLPFPLWTRSTVVGLFAEEKKPHQVFVQTASETKSLEAKAILIASGAMEQPREAHRIPGSRPAGVMTPYLAMELLARGELPGNKILSVGDTRMHQAASEELRIRGCEVTQFTHGEAEVKQIFGSGRVTGAHLYDRRRQVETSWLGDTVLFSKDRIPCTFFLKGTPVERDRHYAVVTDEAGRTNIPRIYATGSCTVKGDADHANSVKLAQDHLSTLWEEAY